MIAVMMQPKCALLAVVLLAACGSESAGDAAGGAAPDSAAPAAAGQGAADTAAPAPAAASAPAAVLAPDGVEVAAGGARKRLAFGDARERVLADAAAALGAPRDQGTQEECPAGPLYFTLYEGGLQLVFRDSAFVGWAAREGSVFRTAAGIGFGSTVDQLKAAYPAATIQESSLGTEFAAGDVWGIVNDLSTPRKVEVMFAGINCIFR